MTQPRALLAQMRSADRVRKCLLFGVDRTYRGYPKTDAFDPQRTSHLLPLHHLPTSFARSVLNTHAVSDDGKSLGS